MQASLDFGRGHRVLEAHRRVLRVLADAVDAIGLVQAAGACDARKSELADALAGREGRYMRTEWLLAIADVAPPDFRDKIMDAIAGWLGLMVQPAKLMTPEERADRLEQKLRSLGPVGEQMVLDAIGGRR